MIDPWLVSGVPVLLKRSSRRRTVGLQVRPGHVTLYAPTRFPQERLHTFLLEKRQWVEHHLARYAEQRPAPPALVTGTSLPFLNEHLTLQVGAGHARASRKGTTLHLPAQAPEHHLERWTRAACRAPYEHLVQDYAQQLDAAQRLRRVLVSGARTRWGSCTAAGDIRLHWKLSRAPQDVLAYVALHEAAHLLELNHSARYWAHVARLMPDYAVPRC